jgi:hypothetical protein
VDASIGYVNSGRQPADLERNMIFKIFTKEEWFSSPSGNFLRLSASECLSRQSFISTSVVYPSISYTMTQRSAPILYADIKLISGENVLALIGCLVYSTFGVIHHSAFCYDYSATESTNINELLVCHVGNAAD